MNIPQITADEVKKAIDNHEEVVLLDVRTPGEYSRGHIAGSINVPVEELGKTIEDIITDKTKKLHVYCLSGARSNEAVEELIKLGYTHVFSMINGLLMWRAKHYPLSM
ncbi:rhodanese-like domain-containing protein [Candidatus Roizmanbacteria bacterium]|nr:rhodanese-like domain-containing protein [Candidatus Roizmanbacteria bacterium]